MRVVVVVADFYTDIATGLLRSCCNELDAALSTYTVVHVAGVLEIPFALARLADRYPADCMVALGCVIRGETYHFEVVATTSAAGILQVSLTKDVPIGNGVLTVDTLAQAQARLDKGAAAARAALQLSKVVRL